MKRLLITFVLLLTAIPLFCQTTEKITGTLLPEVLLTRIPDTEYVYISIVVRSGPANESNSTAGFSALIASLLLKETDSKSPGDLERIFYNLNGSMSIATGLDYTELRLLTVKANLKPAMRIIGECLTRPVFSQETVENARDNAFMNMVKEEDTPFQQTYTRLRWCLYSSSPYKRSMYGNAGAIKRASPKQLYTFFNENFCPRQIILSVAGDLSASELENAVKTSFFRSLPSPERRRPYPYSEKLGENKREVISSPGSSMTYYMLGFLAPGAADEDWAPMALLSGIIGSGKSGRLFRIIRQQKGCGYSIGCIYPSLLRQSHMAIYTATGTGASPESLREYILEIIKDLQTTPVSPEELTRARNYMITQEEIERENPVSLTHSKAVEVLYGISLEQKIRLLEAVTPGDIMECANKYMSNYAEVICRPEAAE